VLASPTREPSMVIAGISNGFEHSGKTCCGAMSLFRPHTSPDLAAALQLQRSTSIAGPPLTCLQTDFDTHVSSDTAQGHVGEVKLRASSTKSCVRIWTESAVVDVALSAISECCSTHTMDMLDVDMRNLGDAHLSSTSYVFRSRG